MTSWADVQTALIKEARELLQPSKVKTGKIPPWLRSKLRKAKREGRIDPVGPGDCFLLEAAAIASSGSAAWLDHWGRTAWNFKDAFVSEPYQFEEESARKFAELLGIDCELSPNSWHFPGRTFRLLFYPKEGSRG